MLDLYAPKSKILLMNGRNALNSLQIRNNSLKSKLFHEQLKLGQYSFEFHRKYMGLILNEYKKTGSLVKSSEIVGIDYEIVFKWYFQGLSENPNYRNFYLTVRGIGDLSTESSPIETNVETLESSPISNALEDGEYVISKYGDGWSYKTYVDGEKIFIISNELETLEKKVKDKRLPID